MDNLMTTRLIEEVGKNFQAPYFEDLKGSGVGSCGPYTWQSESVQYWLKIKYDFFYRYLGDKEIKKILFVGCSKGFEVKYFREHGLDAYGVDISSWAIEHAESEAKPFCRVADVSNLPFGDQSFDCVLSFAVLALLDVDMRAQALVEMQRVSKEWLLINWSIRPWNAKPKTVEPDCYDGNPVWTEPLEYWIKLVDSQEQFCLWFGYLPPAEVWSAWCIWKRGIRI